MDSQETTQKLKRKRGKKPRAVQDDSDSESERTAQQSKAPKRGPVAHGVTVSFNKTETQTENKRDQKYNRKSAPTVAKSESAPLKQKKKQWHCCMPKKDGCFCPGTAFDTDEMWRHMETKQHLGAKQDRSKSFPYNVKRCAGKNCCYCKSLNEEGKSSKILEFPILTE